MSKKLSNEEVAARFAERGCVLLSDYQGRHVPIRFICRCGNESEIRLSSFERGSYCFSCSGKSKRTLSEISEAFAKEGYIVISDEYQNATHKIDVICPRKHVHSTSWNNFQQGRRCRLCSIEKVTEAISGPKHYAWIADRSERKLRHSLSVRSNLMIKRTLNYTGTKKVIATEKALGYSRQQLRDHLENHPNWANVKYGEWHIDHKFPVKAFLDFGIKDVALINCLDNLQPMDSTSNLRKQAAYDKSNFLEWLKIHGVFLEAS